MKLTDKQERFCQEYIIDLNATQAAIRAGYSAKTAHVTGFQNLEKPNIQARLRQIQRKQSERTEVTQDDVIQELARLAFSNIGDFMEWDESSIRFTTSDKLSRAQKAAIQTIKAKQVTIFNKETKNSETTLDLEIKLHDKFRPLEKLGEHTGVFSRNDNVVKNLNLNDLSNEQLDRIAKGEDPIQVLADSSKSTS